MNIIVVNCHGGLVQDVGSLSRGNMVYVIDHDIVDEDGEPVSEAVWSAECCDLTEWTTDSESALGRIAQAMDCDLEKNTSILELVSGTYSRGTPVPEFIREAWAKLKLGEFPSCYAEACSHVTGNNLADYLAIEWEESSVGEDNLAEGAGEHMLGIIKNAITELENFASAIQMLANKIS